jgi:D-alanyl-D-alanine carboxypeptidase
MLTALLVVESLPDDQVVTISQRAARAREGRAIGLEVGEQWRVGELLKVMMVHSANDAAVALAEAVAGSVEAFATLMNAKAIALGARESHFVDPHGLENPAHYSTAHDLAVIARAALQQPRIADVVRLRTWELTRHGQRPRLLVNSNRLLWRYPYADGVKTGWIPQSGHCLVASATRDGRKLIAVILDDQRPFTDAAALLDYGYTHYRLAKAAETAQVQPTLPVANVAVPLVATEPSDMVIAAASNAAVSNNTDQRGSPTSLLSRLLSWIAKSFEQWS